MSIFTELIKAFQPISRSQNDFDEQYLAEAASVYDLERRMREIDRCAKLWQRK